MRGLALLAAASGVAAFEFTFGPRDALYPDYLADPRRPRIEAAQVVAIDSEVSDDFDVGVARFALAVGERLRMARWSPPGEPAMGWQLDVDAGFFAQFDQEATLDNLGWDGIYGAHLSWRGDPRWAVKLAYRHVSSHLGDEFVAATGRERIEYTRDDLSVSLAWTPSGPWLAYAELGVAPATSAERQEPLALQFGGRYQDLQPELWDRFGWYLALDVQLFQEEDFEPDVSLRTALVHPTQNPGRGFELGLQARRGRSELGEFTPWDETTLALFLTYDL